MYTCHPRIWDICNNHEFDTKSPGYILSSKTADSEFLCQSIINKQNHSYEGSQAVSRQLAKRLQFKNTSLKLGMMYKVH